MSMVVVAVVGSRDSGKTRVVELLIRRLMEMGCQVATAKHIPEVEFTIDTRGKDTWRHAMAGARRVISIAPRELAVIKKIDTTSYRLEDVVKECGEETDIILLEGFKGLIGQELTVPKIVTVKTVDEVLEAYKQFKPILAFAGFSDIQTEMKFPYVNLAREPEKLVEIVAKRVVPLIERRRKRKEEFRIEVDGDPLTLKPFVRRIMRNTILAMISTLKGVAIKGDENVHVAIKSPSKVKEVMK
ncbi:MAG: molybdopterin-guanine dinucleotide biosynthesis protein B [Candidatus Freyarchaeota archaeon]